MKRFLLAVSTIISVFFLSNRAIAQGNQIVVSGSQTAAVNFPAGGCSYNWVNNTPGIGLPAGGTGNIAAFTAVNTGNTPITAMITATPTAMSFIYIPDFLHNSILVYNSVTGYFLTSIAVDTEPTGASLSPDGSRLYVANAGFNDVSVINTANNTVISTITVGYNPNYVTVSTDGSTLYVPNFGSKTISIINTATNTVVNTVSMGQSSIGVSGNSDGSKVYIANGGANTVSIINSVSNTIISTIQVGTTPFGVSVSPDGSRLYVANMGSNTLSVINTSTTSVVATIPVGSGPEGVSVSSDGTRVYVTNHLSSTVSVIDAATNTVISTIATGINPLGISVNKDNTQLFVENANGNTVSVIDLASGAIISTLTPGIIPAYFGNFSQSGPACTGSPITFTITVKPSSVTPTITASTATGTISACQGSPSASPDIQQFTVSGTGLTNNITATAPAGFELALSTGGVYTTAITVPQSGGTANNTTVYVRSAASATGNIAGNVVLSSPSASPQNVAVLGIVKPLPTVNSVGNQIVSTGNNTTAINFTGTTNDFSWVNSIPGIGLQASGAGNIPAFTAVNNGNTPITATVTVTPTNKQVYAYIPSANTADVSVIDLAANKTIAKIPVGLGPMGVAVTPDGTKIYVTNQASNTISVINIVNYTTLATITAPSASDPTGVVVSPDGSKVYVTCYQLNTVLVINAATNTIINTIAVGTFPFGICVSADGSRVYTANLGDNTISVINTATNTIIATIPVGLGPNALCISPDGSTLYTANYGTNNVSVINALNNTVTTSIATGAGASVATLSPDGKTLYVSNGNDNTVSVINTTNNTVIATIPVNMQPFGLSVSRDGTKLYIAQLGSKTIAVVNTQTNTVTNTINVGLSPYALGNFISETPGCDGPATTFKITVNPLSVTPAIAAGTMTGTISACQGSASVSPHIGQFTVSGNNLTNGIIATAPSGFQLSLSATGVYSSSLTIPHSGGTVNNVTIYVGLAASAAGNKSGNVTLTSSGAADKTIMVTGNVNALPTVGPIANQKVVNGAFTKEVDFAGTGDTYNWVNDNPAIGIGYGTSIKIVQFIGTNTSNMPMTGTFTVTPINTTTGCSGTPVTFTIEVDPILPAVIRETGTLSPLSTIYGTPSASTSFSVSGANINGGILAAAPPGFEVSTDNTNFSQTVTIGTSGTIAKTTVYVRLTSRTPVSSYSGNIVLSSNAVANVNVSIPYSIVNPAPLVITANNVQKQSGQTLTNGFVSAGFTSTGLQNNETIGNVFMAYNDGTGASAKVGTYTGSAVPSAASGGSFNPKNYTITYKAGDIIVTEGLANTEVAIPNAFTPNGDGINDVWNIKSLIDYPSCLVSIFTRYGSLIYQSRGYAKPWDGVYNGSPLPTGTYYYIINLQNGQQPLSGYVALIR